MMRSSQQPVVLVTATTWWPLSARLSSRLLAYGCKVTALCPAGHPLRHLPGVSTCHSYQTLQTQASLANAIRVDRPDIVIPTDDLAVQELQRLALSDPAVRGLYERSMGSLDSGMLLGERDFLCRLAKKLGIAAAESVPVSSIEEASEFARQWGYPVVLKKDATWGGNGVFILRDESELAPAFLKLERPITFAARCKRRLINSDSLAFASSDRHSSKLTLQRYVEGTPANAMFACFKGDLLSAYQVQVCASLGRTGAAVLVEPINDPRIQAAGAKLAAELKLSGFFGLDFVLRRGSNEPLVIELNPRTTQLGHLPLQDGSDLAAHMYAAWTGNPVPRATPHAGTQLIAFFPQAWHNNVDPALLANAYHDKPQESSLIKELEKAAWPERQWFARAYHAFRKPAQTGCFIHSTSTGRPGLQSNQAEQSAQEEYINTAAAQASLIPVS